MQSRFFARLSLIFCLLLLGGCDSAPQITPLGEGAVVLAFGDSLTYGTGAPAGHSYPEVLAGLLDRQVVKAGVPGEVTSAGLARLPAALDSYNPSLVILCHGGNDFLRRLDPEETRRNLEAMVGLIRNHGADVILVGVPKLGFGLEIPKLYATIAEEFALPLDEEILLDLLGDNSLKSDAIHPNAAGYRQMAETIQKLINKSQRH